MQKTVTIIFGIFFLVAGAAGFLPALAPHGMLFGFFMVGPVHNCVHLASGVVALLCAFGGFSRLYLQLFGVVYAIVALVGFFYGNHMMLGIMEHNKADIGLHIAIAAVALFFGFKSEAAGARASR